MATDIPTTAEFNEYYPVTEWDRNTVADGKWLNSNTVKPLIKRDIELLKLISANAGGGGGSDLEERLDTEIEERKEADTVNANGLSNLNTQFNDDLSLVAGQGIRISENTSDRTLTIETIGGGGGDYVPLDATACYIGSDNIVGEGYGFAQGGGNSAYVDSLAQGGGNSAYGDSLAQGSDNSAYSYSLAQGIENSAVSYSLAQGDGNRATNYSVAFGGSVTAKDYSIAAGCYVKASGYAAALGHSISAENHSIVAGGGFGKASDYAAAFGYGVIAEDYSIAAGDHSKASSYAAAFGNGVTAENRSIAAGGGGITAKDNSIAAGGGNMASGYAAAFGYSSKASRGAAAFGGFYIEDGEIAPGCSAEYNSIAAGGGSSAFEYGFAFGGGVVAKDRSIAIGGGSTAENYSIVVGGGSKASGYAAAFGQGTTAEDRSIAIGGGSTAENYSIVAGGGSKASGYAAAFGGDVTAENGSIAAGSGCIASEYAAVFGRYNSMSSDISFVIGNGSNSENRSDAFVIYPDGRVSAAGKISADGVELGTGGGGSVTEIFYATYNVTTYQEIDDAVAAGKYPVLKFQGNPEFIVGYCGKEGYNNTNNIVHVFSFCRASTNTLQKYYMVSADIPGVSDATNVDPSGKWIGQWQDLTNANSINGIHIVTGTTGSDPNTLYFV